LTYDISYLQSYKLFKNISLLQYRGGEIFTG
jgi:hypothetical protein